MTRFWPDGLPVAATYDAAGVPLRLQWQGRTHTVAHIAQRWRVDEGWWRWRVWRDYWKLTTDSGRLLVVYHDLVRGEWFLQRLYD